MKFIQVCCSVTLNNIVFLLSNLKYISCEELDRRLSASSSEDTHPTKDPSDPLIIFDARRPDEYEESHIHGAINLHYSFWKSGTICEIPELRNVAKDREIVTYCCAGFRSGLLARILRDNGYKNVKVLKDGFYNWANCGKPMYKEHHILATVVKPQHFLASYLLKKQLIKKQTKRAKNAVKDKASDIKQKKKRKIAEHKQDKAEETNSKLDSVSEAGQMPTIRPRSVAINSI